MPNLLLNLWGCNTWLTDSNREAAVAVSESSSAWGQTADEIIQEVETQLDSDEFYMSEQESPYTAEEWYDSLTEDWPEIDAVIDPSLFISSSSVEAREHWREHWWKGTSEDSIQCFDYAAYQLVVAGFFTTSWRTETTTYQVFREDTGVSLNETAEGVRYLKQALAADTPVLVGIRLATYDPRPNPDKTTNHFVVIVGMGVDVGGHYFLYYDYLGDSDGAKFHLSSDLKIETLDGKSRVAQIRQTTSL